LTIAYSFSIDSPGAVSSSTMSPLYFAIIISPSFPGPSWAVLLSPVFAAGSGSSIVLLTKSGETA
jgi:hypothetical protein